MKKAGFRICCLAAALFTLICIVPPAFSAGSICFTAIDDTLPFDLSSSSMPFWDGGELYVPYTVFEHSSLNIYTSYDKQNWTLSLYNKNNRITFYITMSAVYDSDENYYEEKIVMSNSNLFVPVVFVCEFFGLSCSYITSNTDYPIVRIRTGSQSYSDSEFAERAASIIESRALAYSSGHSSSGSDGQIDNNPRNNSVNIQLCVNVPEGLNSEILDLLLEYNINSSISFGVDTIKTTSPDTIRRAYFDGHSFSLITGNDISELSSINSVLDGILNQKSRIVIGPVSDDSELDALKSKGYIPITDYIYANEYASDGLAEHLSSKSSKNDCILCIDVYGENVEFFRSVLKMLSREGHIIGPVTETY